MTKIWPLALGLLILAIASIAVACGNDDNHASDPSPSAVPGVTEVHITASDELKFTPSSLSVNAGQPVRLVIDNSQNTALHDWTIHEIPADNIVAHGSSDTVGHDMHGGMDSALHVAVPGGETGSIDFTPTQAGEYEFVCTETGHSEGGMKGTLTVTA